MRGLVTTLTSLFPGRSLLTRTGVRLVPTPATPDNGAQKCWRCNHWWHGLDCNVSTCSCSSAWVHPHVIAHAQISEAHPA